MEDRADRDEVAALVPKVCLDVFHNLSGVAHHALARAIELAPACATGRPGDTDDLLGGIRRVIEIMLRGVEEDRTTEVGELSSVAMFGAQRARVGMARSPLVPLLDAVRETVLDALHLEIAVLDIEPAVAVDIARTTARRVDELAKVLREALLAAYDHAAPDSGWAHAMEEAALVDRILGERQPDDEAARCQADRLGRRLGPWVGQVLLLGDGHDDAKALRARAEGLPHTQQRTMVGPPAWTPTLHVPVLVSCADRRDWAALRPAIERWLADIDACAVSVEPGAQLRDVAHSYVRAQRLLRWMAASAVGTRLVDSRRLHLLDLLRGAAGTGDPDCFVASVLGPLLDRADADELVELVEVTYRCEGSTIDVARLVHRHRNTVRKQLARIEDVLGLSLDCPADRHLVDSALAIRRTGRVRDAPPPLPQPR